MSTSSIQALKLIGRGSEASVFLDQSTGDVIKRFDRAPIRTARGKAEREFARLSAAHALTKGRSDIRVPEPVSLERPHAAYRMGIVSGQSILSGLMKGTIIGDETIRLAQKVAEGLTLFGQYQADCTLEHVHVAEDGTITFLDFGNGSEDENGIEPSGLRSAFIEIAGSSLYEYSRLGRHRGLKEVDECGRFLAHLALALNLEWTTGLERKIWHSFAGRGLEGSLVRFVWYRTVGTYNVRRIFKAIRPLMPAPHKPSIETVFAFVHDFPAHTGSLTNGVHKVVDGLLDSLANQNVHPVLLTLGTRYELFDRGNYTIEVHPLEWGLIPSSLVERIEGNGEGTVTLLNGTFNVRNTLLGWRLARRKLPFFMIPHGVMDNRFFSVSRIRKWIYWNLFERPMLNRSSGILSYDGSANDPLPNLGIDVPLIATRNGICDPVATKRDEYSTSGTVRFHFFGRIAADTKGLDMLLEAISRVHHDTPVHFTIQGPDSGDLGSLKKQAHTLGIEKTVSFEGPTSSPNPIHIMSDFDVCILPSRYEGYPTSIIEAMMAARPIVCTRVGALAPVMEKSGVGIVVAPTTDDIERGIREVIERRSEWASMGRSGRDFAMSNLDWDVISSKLVKDISRVLGCSIDG